MSFVYLNGNFYEDSEAKISIRDRGFRFGDGLFETVAFYGGKIHRWNEHKERLDNGLNAVGMVFNTERLQSDILRTIEKNGLKEGLARVAVSRGEGSRGYLPAPNSSCTMVIEVMPLPKREREHVNLCVSKWRKIPKECLPVNYKLMQGMNSTLAKMEADEKGFFDTIMLNVKGEIAECSSSNIFWVKKNTIYTPRLDCGVLDGTIRRMVIEQKEFEVLQGRFKASELRRADEVFITNVALNVMPVNEVEGLFSNKKGYKVTQKLADMVQNSIDNQ